MDYVKERKGLLSRARYAKVRKRERERERERERGNR